MNLLPFDSSQPDAPQLVATLGPASLALASALARAGATGFRLNASHLTPAELAAQLAAVRRALPEAPIIVDLQGAKMRVGRFPEVALREGDAVCFTPAGGPGALPLPHPEFFAAARAGDTLSFDDGRIRFRVERTEPGLLEAVALVPGVLRPRKGVNLLEHPVRLAGLTPDDAAFIDVAAGGGTAFAFSFMEDGREAAWLRERAPASVVIGKVERAEAIANLATLATTTDALWICRGDLGEQLGPARMARFVGGLDPRTVRAPLLMAGQVLHHLTDHAEPTRSEVCHLHDLVARGYAGFVLSDETAIGRDPVNAVKTAAALIEAFVRG